MIEGRNDRPGTAHILRNIKRVGAKFVKIPTVIVLSDLTPVVAWADIDLSTWVPEDTVAVSVGIVVKNLGTETHAHVSDPSVRHDYELFICIPAGAGCSIANNGTVGVTGRAISYYSTDGTITHMFQITINGYWIPMGKGDIDL